MLQGFLDFLLNIGRLKLLKRSGWMFSGVSAAQTESIADHSFRTALITLFLCKELQNKGIDVNTELALTLALLHDVPEAFTHDIDRRVIQLGGEAMEQGKRQAERMAVTKLSQGIGTLGDVLKDTWDLFENDDCLEVQLVRACDRLETTVQALEYVLQGYRVEQFHDYWQDVKAQQEKSLPEVINLLVQISDRLKELNK